MRENRFEEAWRLLQPHEARHAGEAHFDYLLGIAALESGRPGRATFVLERVLVANPGHTAARLEIARAYFLLGDRERAAREFRAVLAAAPTEESREVAERYLAHLEGRVPGAARGAAAYVEAAVGRDSNVNAAVSGGGLLVPLALAAREHDGFAALGAGAALSRQVDGTYLLFAGADLRRRLHFDLDEFDSLAADLRAGVEARLGARDWLRLSAEHEEYDLDEDGFRRTQGLSAQWTRRLAPEAQFAAYGQALRIRYRQEALRSESSDLLLAGVRAARAFGRLVASASLYAGRDDATEGRADGDRTLAGLGGTLQRRLGARVEGYAGVSYLRSAYRLENPAIGARREDRTVAAELGLRWAFARGWELRPQLSRTHNRSNAPLVEYGRTEAYLGLRRTWD